jgi:two-component system chemotaxis response regulator CheY
MSNDRKRPSVRRADAKVLVMNNDHNMRRFIQNQLTSLGFLNIYQAANGAAGLDLVNAKAPDVVILDWEMGLDSHSFVRDIRAPDKKPNVPIILLISLASRGRLMDVVQSGVTKFLVKPISLQSLRASLNAVLG